MFFIGYASMLWKMIVDEYIVVNVEFFELLFLVFFHFRYVFWLLGCDKLPQLTFKVILRSFVIFSKLEKKSLFLLGLSPIARWFRILIKDFLSFSSVWPLYQCAFSIYLCPDKVCYFWNLNNSPPWSFSYDRFDKLAVVAFLDINIKIVYVWSHL